MTTTFTIAQYRAISRYLLWVLPIHDPYIRYWQFLELLNRLAPTTTDQKWWLN